jgi:hypothetical protein
MTLTLTLGLKYCESQLCSTGYYCPPGSTVSTQISCGGSNYYCPQGISTPFVVDIGFYSFGIFSSPAASQNILDVTTRTSQKLCEPGYYCSDGVRYPCQGGLYSNEYGTNSSSCKGSCEPGYYCESASDTSTQYVCGDPSVYCPTGSSTPITVPLGYYSLNGTTSTQSAINPCPPGTYCINGVMRLCPAGVYASNYASTSAQCDGQCSAGYYCPIGSSEMTPCPAGVYGSKVGASLSKCSGSCSPGYYCPLASTFSKQIECGGEYLYCPLKSASPVGVALNYFSIGGNSLTRSGQSLCKLIPGRSQSCPSNTRTV